LSTAFLVARKKQELKNDLFKDVEKWQLKKYRN
jgi:hypothetical protein